ncbi:MAG: peptidoglycan-associated lipoprotein Pal [Rickettsiales bacterium]|jgi:peptidoglycan-associated lipoprotein|nr:peptidoglycan-associated lipoprotein Pal [Rickettsiales bacterium]
MNRKLLLLPLIMLVLSGCAGNKDYDVVSSQTQEEVAGSETEISAKTGERVFFAFDSAVLRNSAKKTLKPLADRLAKDKKAGTVTIEGHCDERGTREYNLALGHRRANSVKKYLASKGVAPKRIKTVSYGKERPEVVGSNEAAWAKNRRAVVIVSDGK